MYMACSGNCIHACCLAPVVHLRKPGHPARCSRISLCFVLHHLFGGCHCSCRSAASADEVHHMLLLLLPLLLLQVRRPAPGRLQVRPFCRMWDSANYCNQHQPDFLGSGSDNTCGSALINSSHIAQYTQCTLGGGSCQTFKGELCSSAVYVSDELQQGGCTPG